MEAGLWNGFSPSDTKIWPPICGLLIGKCALLTLERDVITGNGCLFIYVLGSGRSPGKVFWGEAYYNMPRTQSNHSTETHLIRDAICQKLPFTFAKSSPGAQIMKKVPHVCSLIGVGLAFLSNSNCAGGGFLLAMHHPQVSSSPALPKSGLGFKTTPLPHRRGALCSGALGCEESPLQN